MKGSMQLQGKLALVTGGGRRVGKVFVEQLAQAGARVLIHYHQSKEAATQLALATGGLAIGADLSTPPGAQQLADAVLAQPGELALIINSAAEFKRVSFLQSTEELWQQTMQLGVLSPAFLVRQLAPHLGDGGLIVNILDVAAEVPWRNYAHHCVAKAALQMLTHCLALELGPRIRVCGITPDVLELDGQPLTALEEKIVARSPLKRAATANDLRLALNRLLESDDLTGTIITLNACSPHGGQNPT